MERVIPSKSTRPLVLSLSILIALLAASCGVTAPAPTAPPLPSPVPGPTRAISPTPIVKRLDWPQDPATLVAQLNGNSPQEDYEAFEEWAVSDIGETSGWIEGYKDPLAAQGVTIRWDPEGDHFEICNPPDLAAASPPQSTFQLYFLDDDGTASQFWWEHFHPGNGVESYKRHLIDRWWETLPAPALPCSRWVLTEADIEEYDWSQQTITLNRPASARLRAAFEGGVAVGLARKGFVVVLDGAPLYGGFVDDLNVQPWTGAPALCIQEDGDQVTLILRPGYSCQLEYGAFSSSLQEMMERQELYDFFDGQGRLAK